MKKRAEEHVANKKGLRIVAGVITVILLFLPTGIVLAANLILTQWRKRPFGQLK